MCVRAYLVDMPEVHLGSTVPRHVLPKTQPPMGQSSTKPRTDASYTKVMGRMSSRHRDIETQAPKNQKMTAQCQPPWRKRARIFHLPGVHHVWDRKTRKPSTFLDAGGLSHRLSTRGSQSFQHGARLWTNPCDLPETSVPLLSGWDAEDPPGLDSS